MGIRFDRRLAAACTVIAGASFALAYANHSTGDYPLDAGLSIRALLDGDLARALDGQALMGSLSILVRLPFAALAKLTGGGELAVYRLGCVPCLIALGLAGLALGRELAARGAGRIGSVLAGALVLLNPLSWDALRLGHPEELLGAALVLAAALGAVRRNWVLAAVALGLALATKQWAVIAIPPLVAAMPGRRLRVAALAGAIAIVLTLPLVLDSSSFYETNRLASVSGERVYAFSAVYPFAPTEDRVISVAGTMEVVTVHVVPSWLAPLLHPLIALLPLPLTAVWLLRRRRPPEDVIALLALLFLLRCLLDPLDNAYYHVPFLVLLAAWESLTRRRAPLFALLAGVAIWFAIYKAHMFHTAGARNAVYLATTVPFGIWLGAALFRQRGPRREAAPGTALTPLPLARG